MTLAAFQPHPPSLALVVWALFIVAVTFVALRWAFDRARAPRD